MSSARDVLPTRKVNPQMPCTGQIRHQGPCRVQTNTVCAKCYQAVCGRHQARHVCPAERTD